MLRFPAKFLLPQAAITAIIAAFVVIGTVDYLNTQQTQPVARKLSHLNLELPTNPSASQPQVLGHRTPQIFIYSKDDRKGGGVVSLSSQQEPSVAFNSYNVIGNVKVTLYQATKDMMLQYLVHDQDDSQINQEINTDSLAAIAQFEHPVGSWDNENVLNLPLESTGIWLLKINYQDFNQYAYIVRSNTGVIVTEGDNKLIFWAQNFSTLRSETVGSITTYNLQDQVQPLTSTTINGQGLAELSTSANADIALFETNNQVTLLPINLTYLGYKNYDQYAEKQRQARFFVFTDRPLYRPGDVINFKSIIREDDDVRYSYPSGTASVTIETWGDNGREEIYSGRHTITNGSVSGQITIPETSPTGYYTLLVNIPGYINAYGRWDTPSSGSTSFQLEHFRKPEYFVDLESNNVELISGDTISATAVGQYFFGQPINTGKVKYKIFSGDYYDYDYLFSFSSQTSNDYSYGWWGSQQVTEGELEFDQDGRALISYTTPASIDGRSKVYSVEISYEDGSGNPSFARKNFLVRAGEWGLYRSDRRYDYDPNQQLNFPLKLINHRQQPVAGITLTATITHTEWVSERVSGQKYPTYRSVMTNLPNVTTTSNQSGDATLQFLPTKNGSYQLYVSGLDSRGNTIKKEFWLWVSDEHYQYYGENSQGITILADNAQYQPNDTALITVSSEIPNRDIFLSVERGRVDRYQVLSLTGSSLNFELPLIGSDMPNMFLRGTSFTDHRLHSVSQKIIVSAENRKLNVKLTPDKLTYGPGETASVVVETTDNTGNPVSADTAVWAVDKAIFELSDNNTGNIFNTFWSEQYSSTSLTHSLEGISNYSAAERGGGCFTADTQILMADGRTKSISQIKAGDRILTRSSETHHQLVTARVSSTHKRIVDGILVVNGNLQVTSNHYLFINNGWQTAGSLQLGDLFLSADNNSVAVTSLEWLPGDIEVFNLEVDTYHTFFANNLWVHNQKGGGARSVFKDTAYWNPSIQTGSDGRATVRFQLPDNLTTWVLAGVSANQSTQVGQTTTDVIVSKDVVVSPILPNFLRTSDTMTLSAWVRNFTNQAQEFDVDLKFADGQIDQATQSGVIIQPRKSQKITWNVKPSTSNLESKLQFAARAKSSTKLQDIVTHTIPVHEFGYLDQYGQAKIGAGDYAITIEPDVKLANSQFKVDLSSTLVESLESAFDYLIEYPYGCVEQTTSRLVPLIMVRAHADLFPQLFKDKDIDGMLLSGLKRLVQLQNSDGGWSWWSDSKSDPFVSAYVFEYLQLAQPYAKDQVDPLLQRVSNYFQNLDTSKAMSITVNPAESLVIKSYVLSLQGQPSELLPNLDVLSTDILSLAVMTNYRNGHRDPQTNGLARLESLAQTQGQSKVWSRANQTRYGSDDASTAYAIRALLYAGGNRESAASAVRYLTNSRKQNYWSNTYGTVQVMRALIDFSQTDEELYPQYTYEVKLNGQTISQGSVSNSNRQIPQVSVDTTKLKVGQNIISITKTGTGQIYSSLSAKEFHTDPNNTARSNGLTITRSYQSSKGPDYSLSVGDLVTIRLTVSGLASSHNYGAVIDELPAGLIAVNESLNNEQFDNGSNYYWWRNRYEVTPTGVVFPAYSIDAGSQVFEYKARVISAGTYKVPPATAMLMYQPEISGRSSTEDITITAESEKLQRSTFFPQPLVETGRQAVKKLSDNKPGLLILGILIVILSTLSYMARRKQLKDLFKSNPQDPSDQTPIDNQKT